MFIECLKSKIAYATVTETELFYEGSITIDEDLLDEAGIVAGEKVEVLNLNNGNRFTTYAIAGERASGQVCLNGPAARMGLVGDQVIVLSYAMVSVEEAKKFNAKVVRVDDENRIKD